LTISVYEYTAIGSSSLVYIFHKGIISLVLCGYEVQKNMEYFYFEQTSICKNCVYMHYTSP